MPYPPPADVSAVSGLRWLLVAIPDDVAYGRASLEAYSQMADVWRWGLESIDPDADEIRQQWLTAIAATLELWDMNPFETIIGHIDEVEELLRALQGAAEIQGMCCDNTPFQQSPGDTDESTDPVPQVIQDNYSTGDDWGQVWEAYFCPTLRAAWTRLDDHVFDPWAQIIDISAVGISALTLIYVGWAGIGGTVVIAGLSLNTVLQFLASLKSLASTTVMGDYSDWDTHADDFICAIRNADGAEAKKAAAADFIDSLDYSLLVKLMAKFAFHEGFWELLYQGIGADGNELIIEGDGCPDCQLPADFSYTGTIDTGDANGWSTNGTAALTNYSGHGEIVMRDGGNTRMTSQALMTELGETAGRDFEMVDVTFTYEVRSSYGGGLSIFFAYQDSTTDEVVLSGADLTVGEHTVTRAAPSSKQALETTSPFVRLQTTGSSGGTSDANHTVWVYEGIVRGNWL